MSYTEENVMVPLCTSLRLKTKGFDLESSYKNISNWFRDKYGLYLFVYEHMEYENVFLGYIGDMEVIEAGSYAFVVNKVIENALDLI